MMHRLYIDIYNYCTGKKKIINEAPVICEVCGGAMTMPHTEHFTRPGMDEPPRGVPPMPIEKCIVCGKDAWHFAVSGMDYRKMSFCTEHYPNKTPKKRDHAPTPTKGPPAPKAPPPPDSNLNPISREFSESVAEIMSTLPRVKIKDDYDSRIVELHRKIGELIARIERMEKVAHGHPVVGQTCNAEKLYD